MEINGVPFDKAQACHAIALEYARMLFREEQCEDLDLRKHPQRCQDFMFAEYLEAYGYLAGKDDAYIQALLSKN